MNVEKFREYFKNRTYSGFHGQKMTYTTEAENTRIDFLSDIERRFSIDIDTIIYNEEEILKLFKKLCGKNRSKEVSDINYYEIASRTNALRHYYRAMNNKDFPILSEEELDSK